MKKQIIPLVVTILSIVLVSNAQVEQISSSEYYAANNKAIGLMSDRPRRIIVKTENFENASVINTTVRTEERITSDRMRFVIVVRNGSDEKISETILIGAKIYSRENNGEWKVIEINGSGRGGGTGVSFTSNCVQYTREDAFIEGIPAKKFNNLEIAKSEKGLTFDSFTVWFDQQGFFLRSERVKGLFEPRIEESRSVTTYEYDPKDLKIEAPL